eukprot:3562740-Prymnesium_polylepis.1
MASSSSLASLRKVILGMPGIDLWRKKPSFFLSLPWSRHNCFRSATQQMPRPSSRAASLAPTPGNSKTLASSLSGERNGAAPDLVVVVTARALPARRGSGIGSAVGL